MTFRKMMDVPPAWLFAALVLSWFVAGQSQMAFLGNWAGWLGWAMMIGAVVLMVLAALEMRRHDTTVIPHQEADALVSTGVFAISRNPIYLGDVLFLFGFIFWADAPLALGLVPIFAAILLRRFIEPEEARLAAKFGAAWDDYTAKTRRWL